MKHTLLVGLGGFGSRVVSEVSARTAAQGGDWNDSPACSVFDSDRSELHLLRQREPEFSLYDIGSPLSFRDLHALYPELRLTQRLSPVRFCKTVPDFVSGDRGVGDALFAVALQGQTRAEFEQYLQDTVLCEPLQQPLRVILTGSLAGGTGSGIFLPMALYLRDLLTRRGIDHRIYGLFALPGVFFSSYGVLFGSRQGAYLSANAAAALRELDAVNRIGTGELSLPEPLPVTLPAPIGPVFDGMTLFDGIASENPGNFAGYVSRAAEQICRSWIAPAGIPAGGYATVLDSGNRTEHLLGLSVPERYERDYSAVISAFLQGKAGVFCPHTHPDWYRILEKIKTNEG